MVADLHLDVFCLEEQLHFLDHVVHLVVDEATSLLTLIELHHDVLSEAKRWIQLGQEEAKVFDAHILGSFRVINSPSLNKVVDIILLEQPVIVILGLLETIDNCGDCQVKDKHHCYYLERDKVRDREVVSTTLNSIF
jgi:hypothetical protein